MPAVLINAVADKYLAGDFPSGTKVFSSSLFGLYSLNLPDGTIIPIAQSIVSIETVTEENQHKIAGKVGWGIVGGALLGPVGLLAGLIAGGRKTEICYTAQLADGRTFMATADPKAYQKLVAAAFTNRQAKTA